MLPHGWDGAIDGIPLDDGKPGAGEAGKPAEDDEESYDPGKNIEPEHYSAALC